MRIGVFGNSGFAKEVADISVELGYQEICFVVAQGSEDVGQAIGSWPVVSETELPRLKEEGYVFSIGIGSPALRKEVSNRNSEMRFVNLIHPTASFGQRTLDKLDNINGLVVAAGVRMTNDISLGNFGLFNLNSTIGHDVILEDFVSVMPGVNVSGNVHLCEGVFVGTGATILDGKKEMKIEIGRNATVGAGALVTKNVAPDDVVVGVPAKSIYKQKS